MWTLPDAVKAYNLLITEHEQYADMIDRPFALSMHRAPVPFSVCKVAGCDLVTYSQRHLVSRAGRRPSRCPRHESRKDRVREALRRG
jgi:hypothetical protein